MAAIHVHAHRQREPVEPDVPDSVIGRRGSDHLRGTGNDRAVIVDRAERHCDAPAGGVSCDKGHDAWPFAGAMPPPREIDADGDWPATIATLLNDTT